MTDTNIDDFTARDLIDYVKRYKPRVKNALEQRLVTPIDNTIHLVTHPYINMAGPTAQGLQIGNDIYEISLKINSLSENGINLGNNWILHGETLKFIDRETEFPRQMVFTTFSGSSRSGVFSAMFSQLDTTEPMGRMQCGPHAQLISHETQQRLYIIDVQTARALREQCINWSVHQSLTYILVRAAERVLIIAVILIRSYDLNEVHPEYMERMRNYVYGFGTAVSKRLRDARRAETIYKAAIVRQENMTAIQPLSEPEAEPIELPIPNYRQVPQFNVNMDIERAVRSWRTLYYSIDEHQLFQTPWDQLFQRIATRKTSMEFLSVPIGKLGQIRTVRLPNHQKLKIKVKHLLVDDGERYELQSSTFIDASDVKYLLKQVPGDGQAWVAFRHKRTHHIPLHSHGLNGSENGLNRTTRRYDGNNGYQVMSLIFPNDDTLNQQRLYFVNRETAKELRYYFELTDVMNVYQSWFDQLLPIAALLCDARRAVNHLYNDTDPRLLSNTRVYDLLYGLIRKLGNNYKWLVRLEQIWRYSILAPNTQPESNVEAEEPIQSIETTIAVYRKGRGANVNL